MGLLLGELVESNDFALYLNRIPELLRGLLSSQLFPPQQEPSLHLTLTFDIQDAALLTFKLVL